MAKRAMSSDCHWPWPERPRLIRHGRKSVGRLLSGRALGPAVATLPLLQVAAELGGDRVARGNVGLRLELVDAPLELLDVRRGLGIGGDGLTDLRAVGLRGRVELRRDDRGAENR